MKTTYIKVFFLAFLLLQCTKNEEKEPETEGMEGAWNLINVSGGIAGIDDSFEKGVIVWTFNSTSKNLNVQINSAALGIFSGLAEGNYTYSILEDGGASFLIVDSIEHGGINTSDTELVIDQNKSSIGPSADKYVLRFIK